MKIDKKAGEIELDPINTARSSAYMMLFQRLKTEHEQLKTKCDELCSLSMRTAAVYDSRAARHWLTLLRERTAVLLAELSAHSRWEDEELFPVFARYFKKEIEPTIQPSLWVLEKDHELALQFFVSFLQSSFALLNLTWQESEAVDLTFMDEMKNGCDSLTQGCFILNGHFQMEEELIFPLAEQILTDMDYLFS